MASEAQDTGTVTPGHVFVIHGDLSTLACDDLLVPTDRERHVTEGFASLLPAQVLTPTGQPRVRAEAVEDVTAGVALLRTGGDGDGDGSDGSDGSDGTADRPRCWLVDTASGDVAVLVGQVERFVDVVLARADSAPPRYGRATRLLGMPLVGTGEGGAAGRRGEVIVALLPVLDRITRRHGIDMALVLADPRDYAAAQEVRRRCLERWPLPQDLLGRADALAALAVEGRLALFLGAGVSAAAGMPMWDEMLARLAAVAGLDDRQQDALARLSPPDAAQLISGRLDAERFAAEMRAMFDRREHALAHALLAALPVRQVVTTNYDPLLELAYRGAHRSALVLPWEHGMAEADDAAADDAAALTADGGGDAARTLPDRELVKLHGDVSRPEDIVLTRESYLRLAEEQAALTGVVQSLLLTRHVLFVGFSLLDDTFIRVAHQTRRVLARSGDRPGGGEDRTALVGTALALQDDPVRRELWRNDLAYLSVADAQVPVAEAARRLEIFLDRLAASASNRHGWLLDPRYAGLRTAGDSELAAALEAFTAGLDDRARSSPGWAPLHRLLHQELGGTDLS